MTPAEFKQLQRGDFLLSPFGNRREIIGVIRDHAGVHRIRMKGRGERASHPEGCRTLLVVDSHYVQVCFAEVSEYEVERCI